MKSFGATPIKIYGETIEYDGGWMNESVVVRRKIGTWRCTKLASGIVEWHIRTMSFGPIPTRDMRWMRVTVASVPTDVQLEARLELGT